MSRNTPYVATTSATATGGEVTYSRCQYTNTNTTTNLNANTGNFTITVPIFGTNEFQDSDYSVAGNEVTVNFTGTVKVSFSLHLLGPGTRRAVQGRLRLNGTPTGPIAAMGYIRNASGHTESSIAIPSYELNVTSGDIISLGSRQEAGGGTVTMAQSGTSFIRLERFEP